MDDILKRTPMRRVGRVEEITDCMVFLASPMSSYMTGTTLAVDGYVSFVYLKTPDSCAMPILGRYNRLIILISGYTAV